MLIFLASILFFDMVQVQANGQQCYPEKILSSSTLTGTLKSYFIEKFKMLPLKRYSIFKAENYDWLQIPKI